MYTNLLFLDANNICFDAATIDETVNGGSIPAFLLNRADAVTTVTYAGPVMLGFRWNGSALVDPQTGASIPPLPLYVSVTPLQLRNALSQAGLRQAVEAFVDAAGLATQDAWHYATVIERNSPLIVAGAAKLNLTEKQIDDLFTLAATL